MNAKIRLDTRADVDTVFRVASNAHLAGKPDIFIEDRVNNVRVNARSMIGLLYAFEFTDVWCVSEGDYWSELEDVTIIE
jgi:hypothetical protein